MASFTTALAITLGNEGGFSDNQYDTGGATNFGITEATARRHGYTGPMDTMPQATALAIYRTSYWLEWFDGLEQRLADALFDHHVNTGDDIGQLFQRALNLCSVILRGTGERSELFTALVEDGEVGQATLAAYSRLRNDDQAILLATIQGERYCFYRAAANNKRHRKDGILTQRCFWRSWMNRWRRM